MSLVPAHFLTWLEAASRKSETTIVGYRDDERANPVVIYLRLRDEYTLEGERYRRVPWAVGKTGPFAIILWPWRSVEMDESVFRFLQALPRKSKPEVKAREALEIARAIWETPDLGVEKTTLPKKAA